MRSIVVANWKMNPATLKDAKKLFELTKKVAEESPNVSIIVAPPALYFRELRASYKKKRVAFAVQHAHFEATGSHTGEISIAQAADVGATHVIIGHAERRARGESDAEVRLKVATALKEHLVPILCVGESRRSNSGEHFTLVAQQLREGLADVQPAKVSKILIAYEPVWAIGGAKAMSARDMHEMAIFIRKTVVEAKGKEAMNIKILYGGSIDETNARGMLDEGDVVGLLVGRASTDLKKFTALVDALN